MGKTCLILEGGAMRGMYTAGVIDVMMENHIDEAFDTTIGVSAGAVFGCNIKSKQIGRVIRYNRLLSRDWRFCSLRSWILTGDLYGGKFDYDILPHQLDLMDVNTYENNPMHFWVVCTDAETGEAVYHECPDLSQKSLEYMRASASMPVASRVVELDGRKLLDGGISDSIPIDWAIEHGFDQYVLVLTQPAGYRKKPQAGMKILRACLKNYPVMADMLEVRHEAYNKTLDQVEELEREGRAFVIRPSEKLKISKMEHDPLVKQRVYDEGRRIMEEDLHGLQEYLSK